MICTKLYMNCLETPDEYSSAIPGRLTIMAELSMLLFVRQEIV